MLGRMLDGLLFRITWRSAGEPASRFRSTARPLATPPLACIAVVWLSVWGPVGSWGQEKGSGLSSLARPSGAEIHGSVLAEVADKGPIPLPNFKIRLEGDGLDNPIETTTDAFGRYCFRRQPPGTYHLAWGQGDRDKDGWEPGRSQATIVVGSKTRYADPVLVTPRKSEVVLHGTVTMADGSSPWLTDRFFGIEQVATVQVNEPDGGRHHRPHTLANADGEFVVTGLPHRDLTVRTHLLQRRDDAPQPGWTTVKVKGESKEVPRQLIELYHGQVPLEQLQFENNPPKVLGVSATVNDEQVSVVAPESTVLCKADATDPDREDQLTCTWKSSGSQKKSIGPLFQWTLPKSQGRHTAYVLVTDGKGGFAKGSITVPVTQSPK